MIKLLYRIPVHLITLIMLKLPLQLIGVLVLFIYFRFFNGPYNTRLPKYLKWFGVWEGKSYGINGDAAWRYARKENTFKGKDGKIYYEYEGWLPRFQYNALRNPLNHFQWEVLGRKRPEGMFYVEYIGNRDIGPGELGWYYMEILGTGIWELYFKFKIKGLDKAVRLRLGYKIGSSTDLQRSRIQWAFSFTPLKRI